MHRNLAADTRIELVLFESKSNVLPLHQSATLLKLVAVERIELSFNDYRSFALPLSYTARIWSVY